MESGKRLTKKANITEDKTCVLAQVRILGTGVSVVTIGSARSTMIRARAPEKDTDRIGMYYYLDLHQDSLVPKTNG